MDDVLRNSVDSEGEISGKLLYNKLFGKTGMGEQTLSEIFSQAELHAVKDAATTLQILGRRQAEGTGRIFIQLSQASAVIDIATGQFKTASYAILGGPVVLARLFTNPVAVKMLTTGARLPAKSPQVAAIMTKLSGRATEIYRDMQKERALDVTLEK